MKSQDDFSPLKEFISPTCGRLSMDEVFLNLVGFINEDEDQSYNLIIGTDSFLSANTLFVSAIIIHRVGHGGRYYYKRNTHRKIKSMRQRIFYEATMSIELASELRTKLNDNGFKKLPVEIHLDVGNNGATKDLIKEIVGMVNGSGYAAVIKPDSYGATKVADRHSK